jgi:hypothetical protein
MTPMLLLLLLLLLLLDLLLLQVLPEWPGAPLLLRRFVKVLHSDAGLRHPDAAVRQASVEFTGLLAARLCCEAVRAEQQADAVSAVLQSVEAVAGMSDAHKNTPDACAEHAYNVQYVAATPSLHVRYPASCPCCGKQ